jgi:hypothetical protein
MAKFTRNAQAQRGRAAGLMIGIAFGLVGKGDTPLVVAISASCLSCRPSW